MYGDKWTDHIGGITYEEVDGQMKLYIANGQGEIISY